MAADIHVHKVELEHNQIITLIQIGEVRSIYTIPLFARMQGQPQINIQRHTKEIEDIKESIKILKEDIQTYIIAVIKDALDDSE